MIGNQSIEYLGRVVGQGISKPLPSNIAAILDMKVPTSKKEVRSFLSMTGYYREYIPNYCQVASPLTKLAKKLLPNKLVWETLQQDSFDKLKDVLSKQPILKLVDNARDFILQTDASEVGMDAVLLQWWEDERWPVAYASREFKGAEKNYAVIEKECLSIVWSIKKFYRYIYGKHFILETDHQPLKYLDSYSCE